MNIPYSIPSLRAFVMTASLMCCSAAVANRPEAMVDFDMPPTAAACSDPRDPTLATVTLRLSSLVDSPELPRIDQWLIRFVPRDPAVSIHDYSPRTETRSDVLSPIKVTDSEESTRTVGITASGNYGHLAQGNAVADQGKKQIHSLQFDKAAPLHAVIASGTIERGRGVYFKLRWTPTQVLEGEKEFQITMRVPHQWRSGFADVSVNAQSGHESIKPWASDTQTIGSANFVVAMYRDGDQQAESLAREIADAEAIVRDHALQLVSQPPVNSIPALLRHIAARVSTTPKNRPSDWLQRLLAQQADPYVDHQIQRLPVSARVAVLDYVDLREAFTAINSEQQTRSSLASLPER